MQALILAGTALPLVGVLGCGASDETGSTASPGTPSTTPPRETTTTGTSEPARLDEEYAVYSALIESMFDETLIVIEDTTAKPDSGLFPLDDLLRSLRDQWPALSGDLLADFETKNRSTSTLERRFTLRARYILISLQELDSIFAAEDGWKEFYKRYPGSQGVLTLSRVGFSSAGDTALLYVGNQSHWVAGEGNMVLLKKAGGRWTVVGTRMIWIS